MQTGSGQAPDLQTALRVSKSALRTSAFQEDVVSQVNLPSSTQLAAPTATHMVSIFYTFVPAPALLAVVLCGQWSLGGLSGKSR